MKYLLFRLLVPVSVVGVATLLALGLLQLIT